MCLCLHTCYIFNDSPKPDSRIKNIGIFFLDLLKISSNFSIHVKTLFVLWFMKCIPIQTYYLRSYSFYTGIRLLLCNEARYFYSIGLIKRNFFHNKSPFMPQGQALGGHVRPVFEIRKRVSIP